MTDYDINGEPIKYGRRWDDMEDTWPGRPPRFQRLFSILTFVAVVVACISMAVSVRVWLRERPEPALSYSTQQIESIDPDTGELTVPLIPGYDGPAVCIGDPVPVRTQLTVLVNDKLEVTGTRHWTTSPPGFDVELPSGRPATFVGPAVIPLTFVNSPMPPEVEEFVRNSSEPAVQFRIRGTVRPTQTKYRPTTWTTTDFWVVDCERVEDG